MRAPLSQFRENLSLWKRRQHLIYDNIYDNDAQQQVTVVLWFSFPTDLSPLIPEGWVQLSMRQQAGLKASKKLEEVAPFWEM